MDNEAKRHLKVFLCHASQDKPAVYEMYRRLIAEGVDAWLDRENLLAGEDWSVEIPKAVRASDVVVICLSNNSINKEGYVQTEITFALDIAKEKPEGTIFLIPTRLEECAVPNRLSRWQWVDFFNENGFEQLMRSLRSRADKIGANLEIASYVDKELKQRIDQLYKEGFAAVGLEDWDKACYSFETILRHVPNDMQASARLKEAKRQKHLSTLYTKALEARDNEDWNTMVTTLEKLKSENANYKDASLLLIDAQKKNQLAFLSPFILSQSKKALLWRLALSFMVLVAGFFGFLISEFRQPRADSPPDPTQVITTLPALIETFTPTKATITPSSSPTPLFTFTPTQTETLTPSATSTIPPQPDFLATAPVPIPTTSAPEPYVTIDNHTEYYDYPPGPRSDVQFTAHNMPSTYRPMVVVKDWVFPKGNLYGWTHIEGAGSDTYVFTGITFGDPNADIDCDKEFTIYAIMTEEERIANKIPNFPSGYYAEIKVTHRCSS